MLSLQRTLNESLLFILVCVVFSYLHSCVHMIGGNEWEGGRQAFIRRKKSTLLQRPFISTLYPLGDMYFLEVEALIKSFLIN